MTDPLWAIEAMTRDPDLQGRIRAAAAQEAAYGSIPPITDPVQWAFEHSYDMCVAPQWGADYAYAVETGVERPGLEPSVIADNRIRSQVVAVANPESMSDKDGIQDESSS